MHAGYSGRETWLIRGDPTLVADRRSGFKSIPERTGKPALMIVTMKSSKSTLTKLHLGQRPTKLQGKNNKARPDEPEDNKLQVKLTAELVVQPADVADQGGVIVSHRVA